MTPSTYAIVASNCPDIFKSCLQQLEKQKPFISEKIVIPWGKQSDEVRKIAATSKAIILDHGEASCFQDNHNLAIRHIQTNMSLPEYVLFLDDDTFLDDNWHEHTRIAVASDKAERCYATVVTHSRYKDTIQAAGHFIRKKGRPHDLWYDKKIENISCLLRDLSPYKPLCPCANCALIPWKALEKIKAKDVEVWDPRFGRWQGCFDFGLKLRLVGYDCRVMEASRAYHHGYQERCHEGIRLLSRQEVMSQLQSRILLYHKFYPANEYQEAMENLEVTMTTKWTRNRYPCADHEIRKEITCIYKEARRKAERLFQKNPNTVWLELVTKLEQGDRRSLLLGV